MSEKKNSINEGLSLYLVLYHHKHGVDAWPDFQAKEPNEYDIITNLRREDVWDEDDDERGSWVEVLGPFDDPYKRACLEVAANYDDTNCEGCGVIDEAAYKKIRKLLGHE